MENPMDGLVGIPFSDQPTTKHGGLRQVPHTLHSQEFTMLNPMALQQQTLRRLQEADRPCGRRRTGLSSSQLAQSGISEALPASITPQQAQETLDSFKPFDAAPKKVRTELSAPRMRHPVFTTQSRAAGSAPASTHRTKKSKPKVSPKIGTL